MIIMDKREIFFLFLFFFFFSFSFFFSCFWVRASSSCIYAPTGTIIPFGISSVLSFYGSQAFCVMSNRRRLRLLYP